MRAQVFLRSTILDVDRSNDFSPTIRVSLFWRRLKIFQAYGLNTRGFVFNRRFLYVVFADRNTYAQCLVTRWNKSYIRASATNCISLISALVAVWANYRSTRRSLLNLFDRMNIPFLSVYFSCRRSNNLIGKPVVCDCRALLLVVHLHGFGFWPVGRKIVSEHGMTVSRRPKHVRFNVPVAMSISDQKLTTPEKASYFAESIE